MDLFDREMIETALENMPEGEAFEAERTRLEAKLLANPLPEIVRARTTGMES